AEEVDDGHAGALEVLAVRARDRVVRVEDVLDDPHPGAMHAASSASPIEWTSSSSPPSTVTSAPPHAGQRKAGRSISQERAQAPHRRIAGSTTTSRRGPAAGGARGPRPERKSSPPRPAPARPPTPHRTPPTPRPPRR